MVYGYVLISTKNSYEHEVSQKINKLDEVVYVKPLISEETALSDPYFEDYNLISKIKVDNLKNLKKYVDGKIHTIFGVEKVKITSRTES